MTRGSAKAGGSAEQLRELGFTDYEARIYLQLLRDSPATAYEIAKATGVPRPNVYSGLEALVQREAVLPVSQNPARYVAADPTDMLDRIARRTRALCSDLATSLKELPQAGENDYVWIVKGEEAVHERIDDLIGTASTQLWIKAADTVLRRHVSALRAAAKRGVTNWIVMFGNDPDEFRFSRRCRVFVHEAHGLRMGIADNLFTLTVDNSEMLTANIEGEVTAACTRNRLMVTMASSLVRHDYYMAEIFRELGPGIDAAFGKHLRDLRMQSFTPEQARVFKQRTK